MLLLGLCLSVVEACGGRSGSCRSWVEVALSILANVTFDVQGNPHCLSLQASHLYKYFLPHNSHDSGDLDLDLDLVAFIT